MAHINLSKLFDSDALSDLEIVFGDQSIKCHRNILYCASEYFEKLLGESRFKEGRERRISLEGDDPLAVRAMLRYIYNFDYRKTGRDPNVWQDWRPHFEVYRTAQKYLMVELQEKSLKCLSIILRSLTDAAEITEVLVAFRADGIDAIDANFIPLERKLLSRCLANLVEHEDFMALLEEDPALMRHCMMMLKNNEHLRAGRLSTCPLCGDARFTDVDARVRSYCGQCGQATNQSNQMCWVERK